MHMEISRCFPWLSRHRQGKKQDGFETLPDNVVVDVLSRLEVDQLGRAKSVCRRWRAVIGTAHFTRVHLQKASSVTVMCSMYLQRRAVDMTFLFHYDWGSREKIRGAKFLGLRRMRRTCYSYCDLLGCCDGLLIFVGPLFSYEIYNPVTREGINLVKGGSICGFFLHALSNEYRLLSYTETPNGFSYHVGGLGPAAWEEVGTFPYRPTEQGAPSGVEGRLHWMVVGKERMSAPCSHSIMVFSTGESELRFMPHPGDSCLSSDGHSNMRLVEMKGRVYVYANHVKLMRVWVLEDYASWHWVKRCDIDLEWGLNPHPEFVTSYSNCKYMQFVDSRDGELLLFWPRKGFFRYSPRSETIAKVDFSEYGLKSRTSIAMSRVVVAECKPSLVSLKDLH